MRTVFRNRKESAVTSVACIVFPFLWQGSLGLVLFSTPSFILCQLVSAVCLLFKGSKLRERERERDPLPQAFFVTGVEGRETEG